MYIMITSNANSAETTTVARSSMRSQVFALDFEKKVSALPVMEPDRLLSLPDCKTTAIIKNNAMTSKRIPKTMKKQPHSQL